jgi:tetratricopeptide (TPR) repeat protein
MDSTWVRCAALVLACGVVYLPVMTGGFIWDDDVLITANPLVRSVHGLGGIWRGEVNPDYFPLTSSLFWLEARLWGVQAAGYHIVNILLHAGAAVLVWRVMLRLGVVMPWMVALIFAVHPVAVETVAWVAEGKSTLSMVLMLAALLEYLRWRDSGSHNWSAYSAAWLLFLLALLGKTSVVALPLVFFLCDWWRGHRYSRSDYWKLLPFQLLSVILGGVTIWFQHARAIGGAAVPVGGAYERFCAAGKALWFYGLELLAPVHLGIIYPSWEIHRPPGVDAAPALLILAAFALAWRWRDARTARAFLFGFGTYCLLLLPVTGLVGMYYLTFAPVADHLQYTAMPAFLAVMVGGVHELAAMVGRQRVAPWALGLAAAGMGAQSMFHAKVFEDQASLWEYAVRQNAGSFEAQNGYALVLAGEGRWDEAIDHSREAVRLNPGFLKSRLNLAIILNEARRLDESVVAYEQAIRVEPRSGDAHYGLGNVLMEAGALPQAANEYAEALRLDPANGDAHQNLGAVLQRMGEADAAIVEFQAASRLSPDDLRKRMTLGIALFQRGRMKEAAAEFGALVSDFPENADAHNDLGATLLVSGSFADAAVQFREALRINPDTPGAHENLQKAIAGLASGASR